MSTDIRAAASLIDAFGASIVEWPDTDLAGNALAYAHAGWPVIPIHPYDCACRGHVLSCTAQPKQRGKRPHTLHGVDDATTDLNIVVGWWERWPTANIGLRVPAGVLVVDIDPRSGGGTKWDELTEDCGDIVTRTAVSGRGDGGRHLYFGDPGHKLRKFAGIDWKFAGYVVAPPSRHAATGNPYRWVDAAAPIAPFPAELAKRLTPKPTLGQRTTSRTFDGDSIADWYSATTTWSEILEPHGWTVVAGDGDSDRSAWRRSGGENALNATIRHGVLFVYSDQTVFDKTEQGDPHGYTRFRAFAILEHAGDLSAAARAAREMRGAA